MYKITGLPVSSRLPWEGLVLRRMNVLGAWPYTQGSAAIKFATFGNGIQAIPEFAGTGKLTQYNASPWTAAGATGDSDLDKLGTAIAASMCGNGGATGLIGVCPNSPLISMKMPWGFQYSNPGNANASVLATAMLAALAAGAKIFVVPCWFDLTNANLSAACDTIWTNGGIVVAAAGSQNSSTPTYPSAYSNVVSVGAGTGNDVAWNVISTTTWTPQNNYGPRVDIVGQPYAYVPYAPMANTYMMFYEDYGGSIRKGNFWSVYQVAGVIGLIWAANPSLTNAQVLDILYSTVDKSNGDWAFYNYFTKTYNGIGVGYPDAEKAVLKAKSMDPANAGVVFPYLRIHGSPYMWDFHFCQEDPNILGVKTIINPDGTASVQCEGAAGWQIGGFCNGQPLDSVELWIDGVQVYSGAPNSPWTGLLNRTEYRNTCWDLRVVGHYGVHSATRSYATSLAAPQVGAKQATFDVIQGPTHATPGIPAMVTPGVARLGMNHLAAAVAAQLIAGVPVHAIGIQGQRVVVAIPAQGGVGVPTLGMFHRAVAAAMQSQVGGATSLIPGQIQVSNFRDAFGTPWLKLFDGSKWNDVKLALFDGTTFS